MASSVYHNLQKLDPMPTDPCAQVHYRAKALKQAFTMATNQIPHGFVQAPCLCCLAELDALLDARNKAWHSAVQHGHNAELWLDFETKALAFKDCFHAIKTDEWHHFATTLSYSMDPAFVSRILDALDGKL